MATILPHVCPCCGAPLERDYDAALRSDWLICANQFPARIADLCTYQRRA